MVTHPDNFGSARGFTQAQQEHASEASAALSVAYKRLQSPWSRAKLLLSLRHRKPLAEDAGTGRSQTDMGLLLEMMEAREVVEDPHASAEDKLSVAVAAKNRLEAAQVELAGVFVRLEGAESAGDTEAAASALGEAEALVVEAQYRQRLRDQAEEAAADASRELARA
jgi:hypothetical protein